MIQIDARSSKPIFQQIVDNVKEYILRGIIIPGDKMQSVREMAINLETNPNTVARAYKELERQKIIETIQGRGTFVTRKIKTHSDDEKINFVKTHLKKIVIETKFMGIAKSDFLKIAGEIFDEMGGLDND